MIFTDDKEDTHSILSIITIPGVPSGILVTKIIDAHWRASPTLEIEGTWMRSLEDGQYAVPTNMLIRAPYSITRLPKAQSL